MQHYFETCIVSSVCFILVHQSPVQGDDSEGEESRFSSSDRKKTWKIQVISGELAKMKVCLVVE